MKTTLPPYAQPDYDFVQQNGRLAGTQVHRTPVSPDEAAQMDEFIGERLAYLESWDQNAWDRDPLLGEVENQAFTASFTGTPQEGAALLREQGGYAECCRFTPEVAELAAFNPDGRAWLFMVDRLHPENSFREFRVGLP